MNFQAFLIWTDNAINYIIKICYSFYPSLTKKEALVSVLKNVEHVFKRVEVDL